MRLINALTFELELFPDPVPSDVPYAILSHTWTDDEVTFQDMQDLGIAISKKGFSKIRKTCEIAIAGGLQYVWVDTCCIDKSSSAELSEAINSMYRWYKGSLLCYAYLFDLPAGGRVEGHEDLQDCRWFTRGWTLQELIAPTTLLFFDQDWNPIGTKEELDAEIEIITGIVPWVLNGLMPLSTIPLAKRMSWAAGRQTCRVEDMAYCLLGIFDVNMPMIYGEGSRAFARLQEEILKKTTDLSLFAWQSKKNLEYHGILADSPADFLQCGSIIASEDQFCFRDEISITNKGVKINTTLQYASDGVYVLDLHCHREGKPGISSRIGIYLKRALDTYFRHAPHQDATAGVVPGGSLQPIYMALDANEETVSLMVHDDKSQRIGFNFPEDTAYFRVSQIKAVPDTYWQSNEQYFSIRGLDTFKCFLRFCVTSRVSPAQPNYGTTSEESANFILMCELISRAKLQFSLYAETGLQSSAKPAGFIDPFQHIERYTPLGDPFSLSVLSPGDQEDHEINMMHKDNRHNYTISAKLITHQPPPFRIMINLSPSDDSQLRPRWGLGGEGGASRAPGPPSPRREDERRNSPRLPYRGQPDRQGGPASVF